MYDEELTFKEFIHKRSVIVLSVLMLICLVFNACRYIRTGLYIGVDTFVVKKNDEYYRGGKYEVDVDKQRDRTKYKFTCGNMNRDLTLFWKDGKAIITFADGAKVTGYLKDGELVDVNTYYVDGAYFLNKAGNFSYVDISKLNGFKWADKKEYFDIEIGSDIDPIYLKIETVKWDIEISDSLNLNIKLNLYLFRFFLQLHN